MNALAAAILSTLPAACFNETTLQKNPTEEMCDEGSMIYLLREWSKYTKQLESDVDELQAIVDEYQGV